MFNRLDQALIDALHMPMTSELDTLRAVLALSNVKYNTEVSMNLTPAVPENIKALLERK